MSGPQNVDRMTTIYGPTTWDVYARLDESLDPRGHDQLYELAAEYIEPTATILDVGCRDGTQLIELARRHPTIRAIGIEPVAVHVDRARTALTEAVDVADRIRIYEGVMHAIPVQDHSIDFAWCRDVLVQVDNVASGLRELHRAMAPHARVLTYSSLVTDRLDGADLTMMRRHLGWIEANMRRRDMERAYREAGFVIERVEEVGTEWREYAEERTRPTSTALLRLSRLRRQRHEIVAWRGQEIYDHVEANLHYEVFMFMGKLEPIVHVLRKT